MKHVWISLCLLLSLGAAATAQPNVQQNVPPLPKTLTNARYVYVTSYDGDQFNPAILPEDRDAIVAVQNAIAKWGKLVIVYRPSDADIVLMVQGRPTEDVLAVYDAHGWPRDQYLWRVMGRSGLQKNETPLVTEFQQAFEKAKN